jgi:hypothetical protein
LTRPFSTSISTLALPSIRVAFWRIILLLI